MATFDYFCKNCSKSKEFRDTNCFTSCIKKHYNKGELIAIKGDKVRKLSLLVNGSILVSFPSSSGSLIRSVKHIAPYPIGALALLSEDNRYRVDIEAVEDCEIISVYREEIEKQIMSCREFMLSFINYSTSKLDPVIEHLSIISQRTIAAKLAYYIFSCSEDDKVYKFNKSIKNLADYLCVERPSLSRVLAQLVAKNIISYKNGKGEILDNKKLLELIENS